MPSELIFKPAAELAALLEAKQVSSVELVRTFLARTKAVDGKVRAFNSFDEADALFGKRTEIKDAHDRFANTDTNYLLQAIENYTGIVLLATNKKSNLDPAFIRRLRYVLEFSLPDEAHDGYENHDDKDRCGLIYLVGFPVRKTDSNR